MEGKSRGSDAWHLLKKLKGGRLLEEVWNQHYPKFFQNNSKLFSKEVSILEM